VRVRFGWFLVAVATLLIVVPLRGVFADMCKEEMQARLELLPQALLCLAVCQLPPQIRDDLEEEWRSELAHILKASDGLPITQLIRGVHYATSMILPARIIGRELSCGEQDNSVAVTSQQVSPERRSPAWTWDEVVLACDLVCRNGWRQIDAADPQVVRLSGLLQGLRIHPAESRTSRFRNPNAVARKLAEITTSHPDYEGCDTHGSRLAREALSAFFANPDEMHALAASIGKSVLDGELGG
jgi:hypothetical protein